MGERREAIKAGLIGPGRYELIRQRDEARAALAERDAVIARVREWAEQSRPKTPPDEYWRGRESAMDYVLSLLDSPGGKGNG